MKHKPRDLLTILAMLMIAALSGTFTFKISETVFSWFGQLGILVLISLFCLAYGFVSLGYLSVFARVFPLRPGVYGMSDFPCFLWKHQAVIRDLAQSVLRPFFPLFLRGVYYKLLGARVGRELGIGGTIADPAFTTLKDHVMIGHNAYLTAHAIVYDKLVLEPITVGMGATIGVNAVVMPGVDVGDQAIVAPGAVVARSTKILAGEFWGGVPAKKIKEMTNKECRMKNEAEGVPDPRAVLGARQSETWAAD